MKPTISEKVITFRKTKSPVREIMDLANPQFFKQVGLNPDEVISFSGGWVNHEAPDELREAYARIIHDIRRFHASGAYPPTIGMPPRYCGFRKAPLRSGDGTGTGEHCDWV